MIFSRRTILKLAGLSPFTKIFAIGIAEAQDRQFKHALTLFDDIKYGPDFKHFDYVNPHLVTRRAVNRIWTDCPRSLASGRPLDGGLSPAAGGAVSRWPANDG
jgi:ABC-type oligopeptide transport system substrate-binding subunit